MVAASKPTSWLSGHRDILFHLACDLGPWPVVWAVSLSTMKLSPHRLTAAGKFVAIRSLVGFGNEVIAPSPFSALPATNPSTTLHLNAFRGEPAISEFDWHFTAIHSSSAAFSTGVGSGFHAVLPALHPDHG